MKRLVSAVLVLVLALSLSVAVLADESFSDVTTSHWAYEYIEYAASRGIVNGMGDGRFEPEGILTVAQFIAIVTRAFYGDEVSASAAEGAWYAPNVDTAEEHGLLNGLDAAGLDSNATRYQMAQIIYNTMTDLGWETLPDADRQAVLAGIGDWPAIPDGYIPAVTNVYSLGIITGMDSAGTFAGEESMTRAQAAVVYCRMAGKIGNADIGGTPDEREDSPEPEKTESGALTAPEAQLTAGGTVYSLRMSEEELIAAAGEPDDKLATFVGYTWYVYGTDTYDDFFMAGVYDEKVAALCSAGVSFSYLGYSAGMTGLDSGRCNDYAQLYTDMNDSGILHMVCLTDPDNGVFRVGATVDDTTLDGESKAVFHLTNAFRHYHGLKILKWSGRAAKAAALHSQDMADQDYFAHTSADGRSPWQRMEAQGISYYAAAENIFAAYTSSGYVSGILAYDGWVNSSGHRDNLLNTSVSYLGVGFGYSADTGWYYTTQDFYG